MYTYNWVDRGTNPKWSPMQKPLGLSASQLRTFQKDLYKPYFKATVYSQQQPKNHRLAEKK